MGCTTDGAPVNNVTVISPLESNGAIPVNIQDQTTPPFNLFFVETTANPPTTLTLAVVLPPASPPTITVASAAGLVAGTSYLGIFDPSGRYYFGTVLSILGNVLTMDTPLDFAFPIGSNVVELSNKLNVNATLSSPRVFELRGAAQGIVIDVTRILIAIGTATPPAIDEFGDLPALTNGIVLRKRSNGSYQNIWNIKTNLGFAAVAYDVQDFSSVGTGGDGLIVRYTFAGQDKHGVAVRLGVNEALELVVQDALSGLLRFNIIGEGHEVTD